ncbi:MAG TPA: hypothetical protein VK989_08120 [Polyangia bacterium]|nr:hypothetical protein [Polyangia bacterium]
MATVERRDREQDAAARDRGEGCRERHFGASIEGSADTDEPIVRAIDSTVQAPPRA